MSLVSLPVRRRFIALLALILVVSGLSVGVMWRGVSHIRDVLPMDSLYRERDFSALLLDISRLEEALARLPLKDGANAFEAVRFALDLTYLRARDNRRLYAAGDLEQARFHDALQPALTHLDGLVAAHAHVDAGQRAALQQRIAAQRAVWRALREQARRINDASFQASIDRAARQRQHIETLRGVLIASIVLFAAGALGLVLSLYRQHRAFQTLQRRDQEIQNLAFFDPLTGLANRRLLTDRLNHALASSARSQQHGALLFLDLDNFKSLNDTQGHDVGDALLLQAAHRLSDSVRGQDTVARLGGDEFVVMLENLGANATQAAAQAEGVAEKIRACLAQPFLLNSTEHGYHISASQGVALFLGHDDSVEVLLKQADLALYQAKDAGRNAIRFFNPDMQAAVEARTRMEADLRRALENHELRLFYQPLVDSSGRVVGAEVLLRWQTPDGRVVSPLEFIGVAEDSGLIVPLGLWVLERACMQLARWSDRAQTRHLSLAVNVSARQFRQAEFARQVTAVLTRTGAPPHLLKLELTESVLLDNIAETAPKMQALRSLGVSLSMDDFGTGYSSLSYLKQLPLAQLKIDRSFVRDIESDVDDAVICAAIIDLAHNLGLSVVAEGVETEAQRVFLAEHHGCDLLQGYLFGKPLPLGEFEALLQPRPENTLVAAA